MIAGEEFNRIDGYESERSLLYDRIKAIIDVSVEKLFENTEKRNNFLEKHKRIRTSILEADSNLIKILRSIFLIFSKDCYDFADILIFNCLSNAQINFSGAYKYLNKTLNILNSDNIVLMYDSQVLIDYSSVEIKVKIEYNSQNKDLKIIELGYEAAHEKFITYLEELYEKNNVGPLVNFDINEIESDGKKYYEKKLKINSSNFLTERIVENTSNFYNNEYNSAPVSSSDSEVPIHNVLLTEYNQNSYYDVDALCGFANEDEILAIKVNFEIFLSLAFDPKKICSKNKFLNINNEIIDVGETFYFKIAEIPLLTCYTERIDLFIIFNLKNQDLNNDEKFRIKKVVHEIVKNEIKETLKDARLYELNHLYKINSSASELKSFYSKRRRYGQSIYMNEGENNENLNQIEEIYNEKARFQGKMDGIFLSNLLKNINSYFNNEIKALIFFESYDTKNIFCSRNLKDISEKIEEIFDLSRINIRIDICYNIGVKKIDDIMLSCPRNFINNYKDYGINSYFFLNCIDLNNYNGSCIRELKKDSSDKNLIEILANGIFKANIYTPLVTQFLPRSYRFITFPTHASFFFFAYLFNCNLISRFKNRKLEKLISELTVSKKDLIDHFSMDVKIRAEFSINTLNLPFFKSFIDNNFLRRSYNFCNTKEIVKIIQKGIDYLISQLKNSSNNTVFDVAALTFNEIYLFERFIRCGSNMHILPASLKDFFLIKETSGCVKQCVFIDKKDLNIENSFVISRKLLTKNKKIKIPEDRKRKMIEVLDLVEMDMLKRRDDISNEYIFGSNDFIIPAIVNDLLNSISTVYNYKLSNFYSQEGINMKTFDNSKNMQINTILDQYFFNSKLVFKREKYYVLYKYIVGVESSIDEVHKAIIEEIKKNKVIHMATFIKNKGAQLRKISFNTNFSERYIENLIKSIHDGLKIISNETLNSKSPNSVLCEYALVYHGLNYDKYLPVQKKLLREDRRYPFVLYAHRRKIEYTASSLSRSKKYDSLKIIMDKRLFNIDNLTLDQVVEYFNTTGRFIVSVDILKKIDEFMKIARFDSFTPFSDNYYIQLFNWQKIRTNASISFEFLLNGTDFEYTSSIESRPQNEVNDNDDKNYDLDDSPSLIDTLLFNQDNLNPIAEIESQVETKKEIKSDHTVKSLLHVKLRSDNSEQQSELNKKEKFKSKRDSLIISSSDDNEQINDNYYCEKDSTKDEIAISEDTSLFEPEFSEPIFLEDDDTCYLNNNAQTSNVKLIPANENCSCYESDKKCELNDSKLNSDDDSFGPITSSSIELTSETNDDI